MKKILSILLVLPSAAFAGFDHISCKVEHRSYRQGCFITDISEEITTKVNQTTTDSTLFTNQFIELIGETESERYYVYGLEPSFEFSVAWPDDSATTNRCNRSSLWDHHIELVVDGTAKTTIFPGKRNYSIPLASSSVEDHENGFSISAEYKLVDNDYSKILPSKRMGKECKLRVYNEYIGFDTKVLANQLQTLGKLVSQKNQLLNLSAILHGNYIQTQTGAICQVFTLAEALKAAEQLDSKDEWKMLSFSSQETLVKAMNTLVNLDVLTLNGLDEWTYFTSDEFQGLQSECGDEASIDFRVTNSKFGAEDGSITNQAGYDNVQLFNREKYNLSQLVKVGNFLVELASAQGKTLENSDWLEEPSLYIHIGEEQ